MNEVSPLRRALRMTGVFAGPGLLFLFVVSAFFGALKQMPGAKNALLAEAPGSMIISMNTGGDREPMQRSYLLVPASFKEQAMFVATADESTRVKISRGTAGAFHIWAGAMAIAAALTLFVSFPVIWRLYRPHPALVTDPDPVDVDDPATAGTPDEHAQL